MGGISFPLKWKIISSNIILLFLTVFLIIRFAADLFNEDKSATLYEATLNTGSSFKSQVALAIKANQQSLELMSDVIQRKVISKEERKILLKNIFQKNERLISFSVWDRESKGLVVYLENDVYRNQNELPKEKWLRADEGQWQSSAIGFSRVGENFLYRELKRDERYTFIGRFHLEGLVNAKKSGFSYHSFVAFNSSVLAAPETFKEFKKKDLSQNWLEQSHDKVTRKTFSSGAYLTYSSRLLPELAVVTLVDEGLIYQASSFLRDQSLYFGGLILGLTILMGIFLSRRMTKDLASLHEASLAYAQGQFDSQWEVKSHDEIGSLAKTFKKMGQDILDYIEEMKDKARLEKEVEVAKLVQESFIPSESYRFGNYALSSYYEPASECGGDWWGVYQRGQWVSLVVADATGHGVPAALLTATASGCMHNLEYRLRGEGKDYYLPSVILKNINYSMAKMESKIHMTAFALVFNKETGEAHYCNASHNPPFLLREAFTGQVDKSKVEPLMNNIGKRLGEDLESDYLDNQVQLNKDDLLVLFSDGLLEETNEEGKEFGQRRFLKILIEYAQTHLAKKGMDPLADEVLTALREFTGKTQWSDDLTFISLGQEKDLFYDEETALVPHMSNDEAYGTLFAQKKLKTIVASGDDLVEVQFLKENGLTFENLGFEEKAKEIIYSTQSAKEIFNGLLNKLDIEGYFKSPLEQLEIVLSELTSNALYHQKEETSSQDRSGGIASEEGVEVSVGQGADGLGIIVEDKAGLLDYDILRNALIRAYTSREPEVKEGGAGLGLLMLFENTNKVFIKRERGKSTKICALIEKERRYKNFKSKMTKFSYWEN